MKKKPQVAEVLYKANDDTVLIFIYSQKKKSSTRSGHFIPQNKLYEDPN